MVRMLSVLLALAPASWCLAQQATTVPQEILDRIVDDDPNPLPRSMAPHERSLPLPPLPLRVAPPAGTVHTSSEYAPNDGMLIRWGSYNSILTQMTVAVTTGTDAVVWVLVTGSSQEADASSTLSGAGADMDRVEFIHYTSNTVWIRDYGPRFIFEDEVRAIVDHTYNRPRPLDNAFPDFLGALWGEPEYDLPLTHGGGNFHLFDNGDAFMSDLILSENPSLSEQDVIDYYGEYLNVDLTIFPGFPFSIDGTKHIDMWMQPVDEHKIIIGQYPEDLPDYPARTITDNAAAELEARGYTVYRTPGWNSGSGGYNGTHFTYTNSVILNNVVVMPVYGTSQDAEARAVFDEAFPTHQIVEVNCSGIIGAAGALHCIVMHVPAILTDLQVSPGGGLAASGPVGGPFSPGSVTYTLLNDTEASMDYAVTHTAEWISVSSGGGSIAPLSTVDVQVSIASAAESLGLGVYEDTVQFINLTTHDGDTSRSVELVVGVPEAVHEFNMNGEPGWSMAGEWAHGRPTGQGGSEHGFPDPVGGATFANVCGVNLDGDYSTVPGGPYYLSTTAMDCSDLVQVSLRFGRWLNTDYQPYAYATVEASNDGVDWVTIWQNGASEIADDAWSEQVYDISAVADLQPTVYVRWGYEVGSSAWAYSGWNIDDVQIWGLALTQCNEDLSEDGIIDAADLALLLGDWGACPGCAADLNEDGVVDAADLALLLGSWGPCQ